MTTEAPSPVTAPVAPPRAIRWLACGGFLIFALSILGAGLLAGYGYPLVVALQAEPSLPSLPGIRDEDVWLLREKMGPPAGASFPATLECAVGEFNALLARFAPLPTLGLVVDRVRAIPGNGTLLLYVQGSGWWQRNLALILEVQAANQPPAVRPTITWKQANRLDIGNGWLSWPAQNLLRRYLVETLAWRIDDGALVDYKVWCTSEKIVVEKATP